MVHFEDLEPSQTVHDINESITIEETNLRRSQIVNLDLEKNQMEKQVFKQLATKVYQSAIPDFVKTSVDYPHVLFDINVNVFSNVYTPAHKDERLYQAPGVIVVNLYLSKQGY